VLGQPLLGVKRVRGCTPTADASMLHVSYTSLEVPSWLYTKNYNLAKSLSLPLFLSLSPSHSLPLS